MPVSYTHLDVYKRQTQVTDYYKSNTVSKQNNTEKAKDVQPNAQKIKSSEDKL